MNVDAKSRAIKPLFWSFIGITAAIVISQFFVGGNMVNYTVLLLGNFILFIVGFLSMRLSIGALSHKNTLGFLRLFYASFFVKFFVLAISAIVYILIFKKDLNKPALALCGLFYILYTYIELRSVLKLSKEKNA